MTSPFEELMMLREEFPRLCELCQTNIDEWAGLIDHIEGELRVCGDCLQDFEEEEEEEAEA